MSDLLNAILTEQSKVDFEFNKLSHTMDEWFEICKRSSEGEAQRYLERSKELLKHLQDIRAEKASK
jgi:hypothetical protein